MAEMGERRLTDARLAAISRAPWQDLDDVTNEEISSMSDELKERRAADRERPSVMRGCGHPFVRDARVVEVFGCRQIAQTAICCDCGAWLSLGESNDSPEAVRIEILAAAIAAKDATCPHHEEDCEWCGLAQVILQHDFVQFAESLPSFPCGVLAAGRATHPEEP
jgi:hypothetical protein